MIEFERYINVVVFNKTFGSGGKYTYKKNITLPGVPNPGDRIEDAPNEGDSTVEYVFWQDMRNPSIFFEDVRVETVEAVRYYERLVKDHGWEEM